MIKHVVSVSGGKDSAAILGIAVKRFGKHRIFPIFCDTGNEHELTYEYLDYQEKFHGLKITRLKADFTAELAIQKQRLIAIVNGAPDYFPSAKFPWTVERAKVAAENMNPTGNPFLDLCKFKGMFPTHSRQFCTEELKRNLAVEFQLNLIDEGNTVITWQGVRRDESARRANVEKFEKIGPALFAYRPIAYWSANDVFDYCEKIGLHPNPLYLMGMNRVGCMPCVNCSKGELRQISQRAPDHIERISRWEEEVKKCSRSGRTSFLYSGGLENIHQRIDWAKTTRGGKQYDLLSDLVEPTACASSYGLCE